ncbi:hypothetical protein [Bacillus cereus]|nr:hypothetical protein [Bacillus cereus]
MMQKEASCIQASFFHATKEVKTTANIDFLRIEHFRYLHHSIPA